MASKLKESSTNAANIDVLSASCPVNEVLRNISPRWKMQILYSISDDVKQFSLLKEVFPSLSDQILSKRLVELVAEGLAEKTTVPGTVPTQVVYTTTEKGRALLKIIAVLNQWGLKQW